MIDWIKFDPDQYVQDNYLYIHDEDKQIIDLLISFYARLPKIKSAVEVGVGPNLYPLMLMLPKAQHILAIDPNPRLPPQPTQISLSLLAINLGLPFSTLFTLLWKLERSAHYQTHD